MLAYLDPERDLRLQVDALKCGLASGWMAYPLTQQHISIVRAESVFTNTYIGAE